MIRCDTSFIYCNSEQEFKQMYLKNILKKDNAKDEFFCIETEETVHGFPDVMHIQNKGDGNYVYFYEFKFTKNSKIHFQASQIAFYKKYASLKTKIVALEQKIGLIHLFSAKHLFDKDSAYYINNGLSVDLTKAKGKYNESIDC